MKNREKSPQVVAPSLPEFLCFAVYSTNLAFSRAYRSLFEGLGLTYPQYVVLVALNEEDDQTVGQLGQQLFLESSTLTPMLKRLESAGYVTRRRDDEDERQVRVALTPAGKRAFEDVFYSCGAMFEATGLDPASYVTLQQQLITLRDNLLAAK